VTHWHVQNTEPSSEGVFSVGRAARLAAAVEGVLRCCNNLLERLHHSYFMYLQPTTETFITIEAYVMPPSLMLVGLFLLGVGAVMPLSAEVMHKGQESLSRGGHSAQEKAGAAAYDEAADPRRLHPQQPLRPVQIPGGWPALAQSCSKVLATHITCAVAGLGLHWLCSQAGQGACMPGSLHVGCAGIMREIHAIVQAILLGASSVQALTCR
jgi:Gaa1-like, GPI transamidase component